MIELLKSMIDWDAQLRHTTEMGAPIIASGEPTALIFCLESGTAADSRAMSTRTYTPRWAAASVPLSPSGWGTISTHCRLSTSRNATRLGS